MSTTIDERVVSMQFDNSHFEQNVQTSMSTLDKLKQKLNFSGASTGLENVSASAKKIDMSSLGSSVDTVSSKFSALEVMGITALANITNSAVNAAKNIISTFTIDPITTGFSEYELKMNSVQTIMASTGESLETVNGYLNELNEYSDKTIYSFSDMTTNIGKFTNAGVELEDAVLAIKGISNEAAVSGANANEASRAMYNFAQALSAGYVKLTDWKSIEYANMATVEFKEQLIATAVHAGTLADNLDGTYTVLTDNINGSTMDQAISATQNFNDSLSYQWMTSEVLIDTLKEYASETSDIGQKAYAAAQDVKTFTMMMDTLKEAAQSGWATTWELIVGDFEEAKSLWTTLSQFFGGIIEAVDDARNTLLASALGKSFTSLVDGITSVAEPITETAEAVEAVTETVKDYASVVDQIISGDWGTGESRWAALTEAGYDWAYAQNLVNEKLGDATRYATSYSEVTAEVADNVEEVVDATTDNKAANAKLIASLVKMSYTQLKNENYTDDQIAALRELEEQAEKTGIPLEEFIENIDEINGRFLLIEGFKNIGESLIAIFNAVKEAWTNVFDPITGDQLFDVIAAFHNFTTTLEINEATTDKITNAFEGLFSILKTIITIVTNVIKIAAKLAWSVFKPLANVVVTLASAFGTAAKGVTGFISTGLEPLMAGIDTVVTFIGDFAEFVGETFIEITDKIGEAFGDWWDILSESALFKLLSKNYEDASETISGSLGSIQTSMDGFDFSWISDKFDTVTKFIGGIIDEVSNSEFLVSVIDNVIGAFKSLWNCITNLDFKMPLFRFDSFFDGFTRFFNFFISGDFTGATGVLSGFFSWVKSLIDYDLASIKNSVLYYIKPLADFFSDVGDNLKLGFEKATEVMSSIAKFIFGTDEITMSDIMNVVQKFITIALLWQSLKTVQSLTNPFGDLAVAFKQFTKALKWEAIASTFKSMAIALAVLTICIYALSQIKDADAALRSAGILAGLLVIMGLVIGALMKLSTSIADDFDMVATTGSLLLMAAAVALMVWALTTIDSHDFKHLGQSFGIMVGVLISMALAVGIVGKLCGGTTIKAAAAILTFVAALKLIPGVLQQYAEFPWHTVEDGILPLISVFLLLALCCRIMTVTAKEGYTSVGSAALILSIIFGMKLLLDVIKEFGSMPTDQMVQGIAGVLAVLYGITAMIAVMNLTSKSIILQKGEKPFNNFTGLATALLAVCAAIWILGKMDTKTLLKGGAAVITILGVFTGMIAVMGKFSNGNNFTGAVPMLLMMALIIAEIALIIKLLEDVDGTNAIQQLAGIALVIVAMAKCMRSMGRLMDETYLSWKEIGKLAVMMAGMGAVIGALAYIMDLIKDVDGTNALAQFTAIGILLGAMTACLTYLSKIDSIGAVNLNAITGSMFAMVLIVVVLGVILAAMGPNLAGVDGSQAIAQFTAISIMMLAMAACLKILSTISSVSVSAIKSMIFSMGLLGLVVAEIAVILGIMQHFNIDGGEAIEHVNALSKMLLAMSACLAIIGIAGRFAGFTGMAAGVAGFAAFAIVIGKIVGVITVVLMALGALEDWSKGYITRILTNAVEIVSLIGEAIGKFVGSLIGGIGAGIINMISSTLPLLGESLSTFMDNMQGFFDGLDRVDGDLLGKAGVLTAIILALEIESLINAFAGFGLALPALGVSLSEFMTNAEPFFTGLESIDNKAAEGAEAIGAAVLALTAGGFINALTELLSKFTGTSDIAEFGLKMASFGESIIKFSESIEGISDDDVTKAKKAAEAGKALAEMGDTVSRTGGSLQEVIGEKDIADFGSKMEAFGTSLMAFGKTVTGIDAYESGITTAATCGSAMTDFANSVPRDEGELQNWVGSKDISTFGEKMVAFGESIMTYGESVVGIDAYVDAITASATAGAALADVASSLSRTGGEWQKIAGEKDIGDFGEGLSAFGEGISDYVDVVKDLPDSAAQDVTDSVEVFKRIKAVAALCPTTDTGWWKYVAGESNVYEFGKGMQALAKAITDYVEVAGDLTSNDVTKIEKSKEAVVALSDAAKAIGFNTTVYDLSGFAENIGEVALAVKNTAIALRDIDEGEGADLETDVKNVQSVSTMMEALGTAFGNIAGSLVTVKQMNGVDMSVTLDVDSLNSFAAALPGFIEAINSVITESEDIDEDDVTAIDNLGEILNSLATSLKKLDDVKFENFSSDPSGEVPDLTYLGQDLVGFSDQINTLITNASDLTMDDSDAIGRLSGIITAIGEALAELVLECEVSFNFSTFGFGVGFSISESLPDLVTLGEDFNTFVTDIKNIAEICSGLDGEEGELDVSSMENLVTAAQTIHDIYDEMPKLGGVMGTLSNLFGGSHMNPADLGADIKSFAKSITEIMKHAMALTTFMSETDGLTVMGFDTGIGATTIIKPLENLKVAAKAITEVFLALPSLSDDIANSFINPNAQWGSSVDASKFALDIKYFAQSVNAIIEEAEAIEVDEDGSSEAITKLQTAATALTEIMKKISEISTSVTEDTSSMGYYSSKTSNSLTAAEFGADLVSFCGKINAIVEAGTELEDVSPIDNIKKAADKLVKVTEAINGDGEDGEGVDTYSINLLATDLQTLADILGSIGEVGTTNIENLISAMETLAGVDMSAFEESISANQTTMQSAYMTIINGTLLTIEFEASRFKDAAAALMSAFLSGFDTSGTTVPGATSTTATTSFTSILDSITENFAEVSSEFTTIGTDAGNALLMGLTTAVSGASETVNGIISQLITALSSAPGSFNIIGTNIMNSISAGMSGSSDKVTDTLSSLADSMIACITDTATSYSLAGGGLMSQLNSGISDGGETVTTTVDSLASSIKTAFTDIDLTSTGSNIVQGLINGINAKIDNAETAVEKLADLVARAAALELQEHSPSKVFYKIGAYAVEGFVNAFTDATSTVYDTGAEMANQATKGLNNAVSAIAEVMESGIETNPTIRPILDLSDIESGTSRMNKLFGANPSVDVLASVDSISAMMNRRGQNGTNDDVIAAINDLGKSLSGRTGDSYNINGITYDDGSNITSAVQTLVRAAKMERRV